MTRPRPGERTMLSAASRHHAEEAANHRLDFRQEAGLNGERAGADQDDRHAAE